MSEEKIYLIKNDHGEYLTVERTAPWWNSPVGTAVRNIDVALAWAEKYGGHIVTFVEEPKKVVLTKEQAEIVERAHDYTRPAKYITDNTGNSDDDEELLMNAYVNGFTVKKKYLVYKVLVDKKKHEYFAQAYRSTVHPGTVAWFLHSKAQSDSLAQFTEAEIEHYSLQDCEKEEVTDDDD
ncbi:phage protein [Lacticaseibacillus rhamnosus]|uniref:DUF1642 domain-containing protein n=1 Tax=Lacticaseibacillus rhamnosus TaxID=47715 RepID=UPI00065AECE4|nr:DUF1642 domain-containing protein [Lacticaseibacillus rhamnosus]KMO46910.1 phage protein [Lacticaseibacillus rhamnosus]OAU02084.1 phage protein [Lacticaseibacillus rhamnosus]